MTNKRIEYDLQSDKILGKKTKTISSVMVVVNKIKT